MKSWGPFVSSSLPSSPFLSTKHFLSLAFWKLACDSPNCNSLLILNKPIFAGEISDTLFVQVNRGKGINMIGGPVGYSKGQIIHLTHLKGHLSQADQMKNY